MIKLTGVAVEEISRAFRQGLADYQDGVAPKSDAWLKDEVRKSAYHYGMELAASIEFGETPVGEMDQTTSLPKEA